MTLEHIIAKLALVSSRLEYGDPADLRGDIEDVITVIRAALSSAPPDLVSVHSGKVTHTVGGSATCPGCGCAILLTGGV